MQVLFREGKKVDVAYRGHEVKTDQPTTVGGEGSAPTPFDLFLTSVAACTGFYVQTFCRRREIPLDAVDMTLDTEFDDSTGLVGAIKVSIKVDDRFPEKYREALHKVVDQCVIKKQLAKPPAVDVAIS